VLRSFSTQELVAELRARGAEELAPPMSAHDVLLKQAIERLEAKHVEVSAELAKDLAYWSSRTEDRIVLQETYGDAWRALSRAVRAEIGTLKLLVGDAAEGNVGPEAMADSGGRAIANARTVMTAMARRGSPSAAAVVEAIDRATGEIEPGARIRDGHCDACCAVLVDQPDEFCTCGCAACVMQSAHDARVRRTP
jgi:hypothetical protein